jgi:hypothetical protein
MATESLAYPRQRPYHSDRHGAADHFGHHHKQRHIRVRTKHRCGRCCKYVERGNDGSRRTFLDTSNLQWAFLHDAQAGLPQAQFHAMIDGHETFTGQDSTLPTNALAEHLHASFIIH